MDIKDEISAMIDMVDEPVQELEPDAQPTEEPIETAPVEDAPPITEEPVVEEPPVAAAPTEEPPEETPPAEPDELARYKQEAETLRAQLDEALSKSKPKEEPPTEVPAIPPAHLEEVDFMGDTDPYELTQDKEALNKLLNTVYSKGIEVARQQLGEGVLRGIPNIVRKNIEIVAALKKASDNFYSANKDLEPFKKSVAAVYEDLQAEHPDWTMEECLKETETETRKRLELHKVVQTPPDKTKKPNFPPTSKGSRQSNQQPSVTRLEREIEEMNASLNS